ncbi:MAG: 4-hydroxythreonine-4-phosphate dehydrogenase PdxA [Bacteroidetes bacterium GWC2_33_15]|nr:MAG: 4-hydroxythreonine-4-phosphate dehydrogenase PdxA [Bacteroidetes bacterium GWA2_33_15]OFX51971.1 MAG: 4-hydroxythreonine-4-phosphate dehydrogenase PdxA [Bacteroidetes bacterium GWC2_33_15]OFX63801.1 MAG: 4-hydroxythreonine-4-phosphate dehydrogenase PdxA [Bacteroidetes bacterium GWB2_32_14]OFX67374.1 MAG: 4-hydroxythreonine-4-phosphate dehydrogenase PdxA [Bacteroidetes bacterium GWD2_33_33]HAN17864.1 4-hydroxythreonine-4-phosphate dehydrogenase PdxA [Bacteroidales bacterium]
MIQNNIVVGISQGDINGISYEVIIKALMDPRVYDFCVPVVYGSAKVAAYHRKALNIVNFSFNNVRNADEANLKRANIVNCLDDNIRVELGKSTTIAGEASYLALQAAVRDLKDKKIDVLVTAPINKDNIQSENFKFPGHTEYLTKEFGEEEALMLMVSENLKVGVVTGHLPISKVPQAITTDAILKKLRIMNKSLIQDFRIRKPKIAVLGLNPHAGDNGLLGREEIEIIIPAIEKAKQENILALGPYPADGFFGSDSFKKFDAILAMYHDQGLVPFKALAFGTGVNFTAGLSAIRTSPGHGTAFEIAGLNEASADSFRNAIYLACDIYRNRTEYIELSKNPLQHFEISDTE